MGIDAVIKDLKLSYEPSRRLDVEIAQIVGWRLRTETVVDVKTGEHKQRNLWLVPNTEELGKIPFYTSDLQAAYTLSQDIAPEEPAAFRSDKNAAAACIGTGPTVTAATPAMALCGAALIALKGQLSAD